MPLCPCTHAPTGRACCVCRLHAYNFITFTFSLAAHMRPSDQVHVDAIRSYLQPSALQIKAVHLPHRALGNGVVSV